MDKQIPSRRNRKRSITTRQLLAHRPRQVKLADAEYLLQSLTGLTRHQLYETQRVRESTVTTYFRLSEQAAAGMPIEYLVHRAVFCDFEVYVDQRVLIPRSETEGLVERTIKRLVAPHRIMDVGTGSGVIAIALARAFPEANIIATEVAPGALRVADRNIRSFGLEQRIQTVRGDLFDFPKTEVVLLKSGFDLIIANLPYVPTGMWQRLPSGVRDYEPRIALDGGPDGMHLLRRFVSEAPAFLRAGGLMAAEIDPAVSKLLRIEFPEVEIEQDYQGMDRYLFWQKD